MLHFGRTKTPLTLTAERQGLTRTRQNFPPTGTRPFLRFASAWRSTTRSILLKSQRTPMPCIHWSLMGNTATPHWVVTSGSPWLVLMLPCSALVTGKDSMQSVPWLHAPKQESVSLVTRTGIATPVTPGSVSALEEIMTILTHVETTLTLYMAEIMGISILKPWDTFWYSERELLIEWQYLCVEDK